MLLDDEACFAPLRTHFESTFGRPSIPDRDLPATDVFEFRYPLGYESVCAGVGFAEGGVRSCTQSIRVSGERIDYDGEDPIKVEVVHDGPGNVGCRCATRRRDSGAI